MMRTHFMFNMNYIMPNIKQSTQFPQTHSCAEIDSLSNSSPSTGSSHGSGEVCQTQCFSVLSVELFDSCGVAGGPAAFFMVSGGTASLSAPPSKWDGIIDRPPVRCGCIRILALPNRALRPDRTEPGDGPACSTGNRAACSCLPSAHNSQ